MNGSDQLVRRALRGDKPSRPPIFDILCNDAVIAHFAGREFDGVHDERIAADAACAALDGTRCFLTPGNEGEVYIDAVGNTFRKNRWTSWVSHHAHSTSEEWRAWICDHIEEIESDDTYSDDAAGAELASQQKFNSEIGEMVFIHATPSTSINTALFGYRCGLEHFSYLWADERELVLRWMRALEARELARLEERAHASTSPMAMIYSDVAFKQSLMFSKDMFIEFGFFDNVARICDVCHRNGLSVIFHSDGYVMDIMDDLIASGIDGFNPIEKAAGMDIYALRKLYPDLVLVGGVDVTHLLPDADPPQIRKEVRKIIDTVGAEGRLLIGSTTELENNVPLANYLAFRDEAMNG